MRTHASDVLPTTTAPASRTLRTAAASSPGTWSANIEEPYVVLTSAVSYRSFTANGRPASCRASVPPA